jgi:hypothetical protein
MNLTLNTFKRDPNIGDKVPKKWLPYTDDRAYLKIGPSLIDEPSNHTDYGIRDEVFDFWFRELIEYDNCERYDGIKNVYEPDKHTDGRNKRLDKCFLKLDSSEEYTYLKENFLTEYEICMNNVQTIKDNKAYESSFSTYCLDIVAVRRLLIEYSLCCNKSDPDVTSTICDIENFNEKFLNYNLTSLIAFVQKENKKFTVEVFYNSWSSSVLSTPNLITVLLLIFIQIFGKFNLI